MHHKVWVLILNIKRFISFNFRPLILGSRKDELELDRDSGGDSNTPPDAEALRIQIQLVEGYLEDALKANRREEAQLLQKNLNELLTCLANLN